MRIVATVITLVSGLFSGPYRALPPPMVEAPPSIPRISAPASSEQVVPLMKIDDFDGEPYSFCTGSIIGENLILTAAHCVQPGEFFAKINGKLEVVKRVLFNGKSASVTDVALLEVHTQGIKPLPLSDGKTEYPQMCFFIGFAGTEDRKIMPCAMLFRNSQDGAVGYGQARGGDSGGPVLGQDGAVIGIVWGRTTAHYIRPEYFYVTPLESIQAALKAIDR